MSSVADDPDRLRSALDRFLRSLERRALRMAEMGCGGREDALELVQDTMLRFVRAYAQRPETEWPILFWRVLDSRLVEFHRRRRVRTRWLVWWPARGDDDDDPVSTLPDPGEPGPLSRLADGETLQAIERALLALPLRQRQAFLFRVWEGLDVAQTAAAMQLSEGSVKTHLFRALQTLRARLEAHHEP